MYIYIYIYICAILVCGLPWDASIFRPRCYLSLLRILNKVTRELQKHREGNLSVNLAQDGSQFETLLNNIRNLHKRHTPNPKPGTLNLNP